VPRYVLEEGITDFLVIVLELPHPKKEMRRELSLLFDLLGQKYNMSWIWPQARALRDEVKDNLKQRKAISPANFAISFQTPPGAGSSYGNCLSAESTTASSFKYSSPPSTAVQPSPISSISGYQGSIFQNISPNPTSEESRASEINPRCSKDQESTLLMNYLDHVFPLQFNFYVPPVMELGRGW
jgi:hypothetical protein